MESFELFGTRIIVGQVAPKPPDNENRILCSEGRTPAEALQYIRRIQAQMKRELAANFSLRSCPKHRRIWDLLIGAEKFTLWRYFGVREG